MAAGVLAALPASAPAATTPPNDDFVNAQDLGPGTEASVSGANLYATAEFGEPDHAGYWALSSVWYRWTAPADGVYRLRTCGSDFDTVLAVYRGPTVDALGRVASSDNFCGRRSSVKFGADSGTTYRIAVDGVEGEQGSIALELAPAVPPSNDAFADAVDLGTEVTASASGTNVDATAEPGESAHYRDRRARASVWYRWTPAVERRMQIDTCGSHVDTLLAVYTGSALGALSQVASDDDSSCRRQSQVDFDALTGETYSIAVDGYRGDEGSIELALRPSNEFDLANPERDEEHGTAEFVIDVPNPGSLELTGTDKLKPAVARVEAAGETTLAVVPRGPAKEALNERGRVTVKAEVTYTPEGGEPSTDKRRVTLIKRG
jgi:hypothetical protein